ncbi:MAG TPA: hypothetical protein VFO52_11325, partial [Longimicrobiales bacterium]|nr:hypothetical protein [Longimicrobiales bacterium]
MMIRTTCVLLLAIILPSIAHAQIDLQNRITRPVQFTGEIGSLGELYSVSGREQRRPSSTGRMYVRSRLELFKTVTVNFDLLYSTETGSGVTMGSTGRQSLNQIGIAPQWSWGRAYAGSFHDSYSPFTYDGVSLRGGGFNINPGLLRLGIFTGRAQSAVAGGATDGAYQRRMTGGKIGFGRRPQKGEAGFIDVVFVRTADDPSSLPAPGTSGTEDSGIQVGNPYAVTPEENVVIGAVTRVPLLQQRLVLSGEVAASIYSRDRRAPVLSDEALDEYSSLMRSFITPRASTYGDLAHNGQIELRNLSLPGSTGQAPRMFSAAVGYRYVGAGYVSLGVASLPADQFALNARASLRFRRLTASVQGMQQEDNLLGQKLSTTTRNRLALTTSFRATRALSSSVRFAVNTMSNDIADAERQVDFASYTVGLTQSINLAQGKLLRAIALSYSYQQAGDDNPLKASSRLQAHDASVRTTLDFSRSFSLIPSVGLAVSEVGDADADLRHT